MLNFIFTLKKKREKKIIIDMPDNFSDLKAKMIYNIKTMTLLI